MLYCYGVLCIILLNVYGIADIANKDFIFIFYLLYVYYIIICIYYCVLCMYMSVCNCSHVLCIIHLYICMFIVIYCIMECINYLYLLYLKIECIIQKQIPFGLNGGIAKIANKNRIRIYLFAKK